MKRLAGLLVPTCLLLAHAASAAAGAADAVAGGPLAGANPVIEAEVGMVHESNVGLAQLGRDKRNDQALVSAVSAGIALPVGDRHLATVTADLKSKVWEHLTGLNHVAAGASTSFRTRFDLGAEAPWVRLAASFAREEYDLDIRDGFRYRVGPAVGKRFGERLDVRLEYTFEEFIADHADRILARFPGDVFDVQSHTFSVRTDLFVTDRIALFAGYAWRDGDVVSTSPRNSTVFNASAAVANDPVFGHRSAGTPANPVVFDRPGVVTIGCNIHDWMIAHIYIAESPHVGRTDKNGRVALPNLPAGRYAVRVWHPRLEVPEATTRRSVTVSEAGTVEVTWQVSLGADLKARRAPMPGRGGYR